MSEAIEAKLDGAKLQPNSGRGKHAKGDATYAGALGTYVIDYKEYSKGIRLTADLLGKLNADAFMVDMQAVGVLKLVLGTDRPMRVAVVNWEHLLELNERIKELECQLST